MTIFEAPNSLVELPELDRVGTFIPIRLEIPSVRNIKIHTHRIDVNNVGGSVKEEQLHGLYEFEIEGRMY